ncbi:MAG: hypothetical protein ACOCUT_00020 [bacterium]
MDRPTMNAIRKAINNLDMNEIEENFSIKIKLGNARFSPIDGTATFKLEISPVVKGQVKTKEAIDFERYAKSEGLKSSDLGRTVFLYGEEYKLVGYKPRSYKYPFLAKRLKDGKLYKYDADTVRMALGASMENSFSN